MAGMIPAASAAQIQLTFNGTINSSSMADVFPVGQGITVTFTYESVGSYQSVQFQQAFYVDHFSYLRMQSGAYDSTDSTGPFGEINKVDNLGNTDGIIFQFDRQPALYQFVNPLPQGVQMAGVTSSNVAQTFEEIRVNLGSSSNAVWSDYALPTTYNFSQFDANHSMLFGFSGDTFGATIGSMTVQDVTNAPEPGTLALMGAAAVGLGLLRRKRKA